MKTDMQRILLAEDDANDIELTLAALGENNLANEVVVVNDKFGIRLTDIITPSERIRKLKR